MKFLLLVGVGLLFHALAKRIFVDRDDSRWPYGKDSLGGGKWL